MSRILHIMDMSPAVYAGSFNTYSFIPGPIANTDSGYRERIIPTGGISQVFNLLYQYLGTGTIVVVPDRPPTVKRGMFEAYKQGRTSNEMVNISREVAEYVLEDCGIPLYSAEGYEADDVIYSLVRKFKDQYDHVYVHTGDSDMYQLVCENVSIKPTSSKAKEVNLQNYEYTVKKGQFVTFNTIVFQKVLAGDSPKSIPPLPREVQDKLVHFFAKEFFQRRMGDKDFMRSMVEAAVPEAVKQFDLIYPLNTPVPDELFIQGDIDRIKGWAYLMRNRKIPGKQMDLSRQVHEMFEQSLYIE